VGCQACALAAERILDDLHDQAFAVMHQRAYVRYILAGFFHAVFVNCCNVGGVDKCCAFQANIHKGCLHARQYAHDFSLVNVADEAAFLRPFYINFLQHTVV
jgi:hypothetical protein